MCETVSLQVSRSLPVQYFSLVIFMFLFEFLIATLAFVFRENLGHVLREELKTGIELHYNATQPNSLDSIWTHIHEEVRGSPVLSHVGALSVIFHCCGVSGYEDWYDISAWKGQRFVPDSCCDIKFSNITGVYGDISYLSFTNKLYTQHTIKTTHAEHALSRVGASQQVFVRKESITSLSKAASYSDPNRLSLSPWGCIGGSHVVTMGLHWWLSCGHHGDCIDCGRSHNPDMWYTKGCAEQVQMWFVERLHIVGIVGLVVAFIQLFGLISSMLLFCTVRHKREPPKFHYPETLDSSGWPCSYILHLIEAYAFELVDISKVLILSIKSDTCRSHDLTHEYVVYLGKQTAPLKRIREISGNKNSFSRQGKWVGYQTMHARRTRDCMPHLVTVKVERLHNLVACLNRRFGADVKGKNLGLPVISSLVYCKSSALDHVATEAGITSILVYWESDA
uniref:Tetraspanin n=1 Tax=Timema bartmani TaxID=61472 RepID=A0A7R9EV59_9NEOP|nr:unnamed protein product [Timema bartmani]